MKLKYPHRVEKWRAQDLYTLEEMSAILADLFDIPIKPATLRTYLTASEGRPRLVADEREPVSGGSVPRFRLETVITFGKAYRRPGWRKGKPRPEWKADDE